MRILVGLDGSELGEAALPAIAAWARSSGAEIQLVSILHPDEIHETASERLVTDTGTVAEVGSSSSYGGGLFAVPKGEKRLAESRGQAAERARNERLDYLRGLVGQHLEGMTVECHVETSQETAGAIVGAATDLHANLIVIATHGRSGFGRMLLGSVAEAVVRTATVPVVLIGPAMAGKATGPVPQLQQVKPVA